MAAAIFFWSADTLFGRYWGAADEFHSLHFEACYHQGIEFCIEHGLARFEPGTQGEHKISRGFEPVLTWSAHFITDRGSAMRSRTISFARARRWMPTPGNQARPLASDVPAMPARAHEDHHLALAQGCPRVVPTARAGTGRAAGLLAAGGDLSPARLLAAYRRGIFPWYSPGQPVLWWSPDPRAVSSSRTSFIARGAWRKRCAAAASSRPSTVISRR